MFNTGNLGRKWNSERTLSWKLRTRQYKIYTGCIFRGRTSNFIKI